MAKAMTKKEVASKKYGPSRGRSVLDFVLRIVAAAATIGSAIAMANVNNPRAPFLDQITRLKSQFNDIPAFTFFVVSNALATGYLAISLVLSALHIVMPSAKLTRAILIILDMLLLSILTAGASAAATITYLAHKGSSRANWFSICHQYSSFCERASGCLVGSFIGVLVLMLLIVLSAISLSRN